MTITTDHNVVTMIITHVGSNTCSNLLLHQLGLTTVVTRWITLQCSGVYHSRLSSRWERYVSVIDCYRRPRTLCVVRALCKVGNRNEVAVLFAHLAISSRFVCPDSRRIRAGAFAPGAMIYHSSGPSVTHRSPDTTILLHQYSTNSTVGECVCKTSSS